MDYNKAAEVFLTTVIKRGKAEMMHRFNTYSQGEHLVLGYLYKEAGKQIVPSKIAKFTHTSTARIAIILNNLESKNLITREISRTDRRKILVKRRKKMPDTYEKDYHLDIHGKHYSRIGMLILILVGTFGAMLMQTSLGTAIPTLMNDFNIKMSTA